MSGHGSPPAHVIAALDQRIARLRETQSLYVDWLRDHDGECSTPLCGMAQMVCLLEEMFLDPDDDPMPGVLAELVALSICDKVNTDKNGENDGASA